MRTYIVQLTISKSFFNTVFFVVESKTENHEMKKIITYIHNLGGTL